MKKTDEGLDKITKEVQRKKKAKSADEKKCEMEEE